MKNVTTSTENVNKSVNIEKLFADKNLTAKSEKINVDLLTAKSAGNKSFWKKEFLLSLSANDKKARRIARKQQFDFSKTVVSHFQTKNKELINSLQSLNDFYKKSLIDFNNFSQIDSEKDKGVIINTAYEILKNSLK